MKKGFTLVELAIVLVIIGLLIGSVLVGEELIKQGESHKVISNIKKLEQAWSTFTLKYENMPGDLKNPTTYFPECNLTMIGMADVVSGNGNRFIDGNESYCIWMHLVNSGLFKIYGPKEDFIAPDSPPQDVIFSNGDAHSMGFLEQDRPYIYGIDGWIGYPLLAINQIGPPWGFLTSEKALLIDRKMDDEKPGTGKLKAMVGQLDTCFSGGYDGYAIALPEAVYDLSGENVIKDYCVMLYRMPAL